jgi:hypothetical protein
MRSQWHARRSARRSATAPPDYAISVADAAAMTEVRREYATRLELSGSLLESLPGKRQSFSTARSR